LQGKKQGGHSLENLENWEKSGYLESPGKNREKSGNLLGFLSNQGI